jgi:hypothetical protein
MNSFGGVARFHVSSSLSIRKCYRPINLDHVGKQCDRVDWQEGSQTSQSFEPHSREVPQSTLVYPGYQTTPYSLACLKLEDV